MKNALIMGLLLLLTGTAGAGPGEEKVYASHLMVDQEVVVSSRLSGVVETIAVNRGAVVSQGQALAIRTAFRTPEPRARSSSSARPWTRAAGRSRS